MASSLVSMLLIGCLLVGSSDGAGHCGQDDSSCEFFLTVATRMTMWRGPRERVYINKTDCNPYTFGKPGPIPPDDIILADGSENLSGLIVVNGTMPGPALSVYVNQEITVHVTNRLHGTNVAIHWHGLTMKGTPWMDGAAFITQCPILPGQTFTYKFKADRIGTHFYHAHSGALATVGLFGPLIVKERKADVYEEHIVTIQDYNNKRSSEESASEKLNGVVYEDGTVFVGHPTSDGSRTTVVDVTSQLVNGRGRLFDEQGAALTCTPWYVFDVVQGRSYRFRVINAAFAYQSVLSVDQHSLSVFALDGHEIEPVTADSVYSHSGERFDFLLTANQSVGNYWMRIDSVVTGRFMAYAILRYRGASIEDPQSETKQCTTSDKCVKLNCPFESYANVNCLNIDNLKSADTTSRAPSAIRGRFRELFMSIGFGYMPNGVAVGQINGKSFELPTVSALTQPGEVTDLCTEEHGCGVEKTCRCTGSIDLQLGDVVQMNLVNAGFHYVVHHPMHTHGYNFHVLKIGHRPTNDSFALFGTSPDVTCNTDSDGPLICNNASWADPAWSGGKIPGIELSQAPLKDTVVVPAGGYAVIRFVVDNPGLWFMHCHQTWHNDIMGMAVLLNDSFTDIPRPPRGFPTCGNFRPMPEEVDPILETTTTLVDQITTMAPASMTCPTSQCDDDLKFTREEFWVTLGVLLFVIVLQFIVALVCLSRQNAASKYRM